MKPRHVATWVLVAWAVLLPLFAPAGGPPGRAAARPSAIPLFETPGMFVENAGQWSPDVYFQARSGNAVIHLAADAIWFTLFDPAEARAADQGQAGWPEVGRSRGKAGRGGLDLKITFPGANAHARLEPFGRLATHVSYLLGPDPAAWQTDVPAWQGVRYAGLYPGLDLEIGGQSQARAWRLAGTPSTGGGGPGSHPVVRLQVEGADSVAVEGDVLRLGTPLGDLALALPGAPGTVARLGRGTFQVSLSRGAPSSLSPAAPGRHDELGPEDTPWLLAYATYLGGYFADTGREMAADGAGNAYVVGWTDSPDLPTTPGVFGPFYHGGAYDVFVAKLNPSGSALVYATFLGGVRDDRAEDLGRGIAVDGGGYAYVAGSTDSPTFPVTAGAYDTTFNREPDVFVARLNPTGTGLVYSTFLGGGQTDRAIDLAIDGAGNAYVTGWTESIDFPTAADPAYSSFHGGPDDGFVAKLNAAGSALVYSLLVGGSYIDESNAVAVSGQGAATITGITASADFPRQAAFDATLSGYYDAFVAAVRPEGGSLSFSTYLGGSEHELGRDVAVDAQGNSYVTGGTNSADFPVTAGAADPSHNGGVDALVTGFNSAGGLVCSTYLGYDGNEQGYDIAADGAGNTFVTGDLGSAVVIRIDAGGSTTATLLSHPAFELGEAVAVDQNVYVAGLATSGLPTVPGSFDTSPNGSTDTWLARLAAGASLAGRATDHAGQGLAGIVVTAGGLYTATTAAGGQYTMTVPPGTHQLAPLTAGYYWSPVGRTVLVVPPLTGSQDFVGGHVRKEGKPASSQPIAVGDVLTYTVNVVYPAGSTFLFHDPVPDGTAYIAGSLSTSWGTGLAYDPGSNAVGGTATLAASTPQTVTFAVRVVVTGTEDLATIITNRACVRPPGTEPPACEWSNPVRNYTRVWPFYLPLAIR